MRTPVTAQAVVPASCVLPYTLPDAALMDDLESPYRSLAWIPPGPVVVLGCSSRLEQAVEEERVRLDRVPVQRRPSGGESMFLSPRMAAISLTLDLGARPLPRTLFDATGAALIGALEGLGVTGLSVRGTSDLTLGERKVLGSAIYQRGTRLFYHAVLNVAEEPAMIQRYLRHPAREPQYRQGKLHEDFVTSLAREGFSLGPEVCREAMASAFAVNPLCVGASSRC